MSKVKYIIEDLEEMPHDQQVCYTMWTQESVEELLGTELTEDEWEECVDIWGNDSQADQWRWIVTYAKERVKETAQ